MSLWYIAGLIMYGFIFIGSILGVLVLIRAYVALGIYIKKNKN